VSDKEREEEVGAKILLGNAEVLIRDANFFYENDDIDECIKNLDEAIFTALTVRNRVGQMSRNKTKEETDE
jgi:glycyl-tRNA synthetase beta subunit